MVRAHLAGRRGGRPAGPAAGRDQAARGVVASNKKARHDYSILDTYEAGMALTGTEVKSL
ncbi:SsrA-binding protein, partial [Micromonospora sp. NPDC047074]|uniref:SsrA-binding protein n=1 Tax=Micromonospora sp. NPDC047074 TaxID=3154339 RepID=UPI0033E829A6